MAGKHKLVIAAFGLAAAAAGVGFVAWRSSGAAPDAFSGEWKDSEALHLLFHNYDPALQEALWSPVDLTEVGGEFARIVLASTDPPSSYVSVLRSMEVTVRRKKQRHLYTAGRDGKPKKDGVGCHSCPVLIGAALFEQEGRRWVLRLWQPYLTEAGSWGAPPEVEPVEWSKQAAGLLMRDGYTQNGITIENTSLLAFHNGAFNEVFKKETLYSTAGAAGMIPEERRETSLRFAEFGPFDVRILVVDEDARYQWDGKRYVSETSGSALQ